MPKRNSLFDRVPAVNTTTTKKTNKINKPTFSESAIETKQKIQNLISSTSHTGYMNDPQAAFKFLTRQFYEKTLKQTISKEANQQLKYDDKLVPAFGLFCVLFNVKTPCDSTLNRIESELTQMTRLLNASLVYSNLTPGFKTLLFVLITNGLFQEDINQKQLQSLIVLMKQEMLTSGDILKRHDLNDSNEICEIILWSNQIKSLLNSYSKLFISS